MGVVENQNVRLGNIILVMRLLELVVQLVKFGIQQWVASLITQPKRINFYFHSKFPDRIIP